MKSLQERLWEKVEVGHPAGCWLWIGSLRNGYGQINLNNRNLYTHRVSYELLVGPIPDGFQIDHLCRERRCVNPDHLEAVTQQENLRRQRKHTPLKRECIRGHLFTDENTYIQRRKGYLNRQCRTCLRMHKRAYKQRVRNAA